uniref:Uncharacterized protein n=1 Tax=Anguilla anguilla TaxID=7936 RepID=A0A0E9PT70_ANGAN
MWLPYFQCSSHYGTSCILFTHMHLPFRMG